MDIVREDKEVYRVLDWAQEGVDEGTKYAGMSYEQGIIDMYNWMVGDDEHAPDQD